MTETDANEPPRSWLPLAIAGGVALLVVVGAIVGHALRTELGPDKQAAVAACEAAYAARGTADSRPPGIVGGDVFAANEWRGLHATLDSLGYLADSERNLTGEQKSAQDDAADALITAGKQRITIVWQLDDESHAQCVANLANGAVVPPVQISTLAVPQSPSTSPSPSPSAS